MALKERTFIHSSESVAASTEVVTYFIPGDGSEVVLKKFQSELNPVMDCDATVVWDYGSQNEIIIASRSILDALVVGTGDGVKKFALVLSNNETSEAVIIGSDCLVEEIV